MRTSSSVGLGVVLEERRRRDQHPGRAEAALDAAVLEEGRLERAQLVAVREALDRRDLAALGLEREVRAAVHRLAVEQHHAGAALGVVAALLRAGQADDVAHGREEARARARARRGRRTPLTVSVAATFTGGLRSRESGRRRRAPARRRSRSRGGRSPRPSRGGSAPRRGRRRSGDAQPRRPPRPAAATASAPPSLPASAASASGTRRIVGASAVIATRASVHRAAVERDDGRRADDGDLHLAPVLEPHVRAARSAARGGNVDRDEQLVRARGRLRRAR